MPRSSASAPTRWHWALINFGLTPWIGIPIAAGVGAIAGLVIGYPTFRLRGHYFALAMLAYPLALLYVFEWLGYQEVSLPMQRESPAAYMQFADNRDLLGAGARADAAGAAGLSLSIERSRFGMSLLAIKQNEIAAEAAGIDTFRWKLKAIVLSGLVAGAIGGFYAVVLLVVTPAQRVRHADLGAGAHRGAVRRRGHRLGAGDRLRHTHTAGRDPAGRARRQPARHSGRGVRHGHHSRHPVRAGGHVLARARHMAGPAWSRARPCSERALCAGASDKSVRQPAPSSVRHRAARQARTLLEVTGLSKSFGGLKAVQDVSFTVRAGEILGIIGPNGAGKTTLFNLLNGIIEADKGKRFMFAEKSIRGLAPNRIARLGIGRTFQVARPFPRLSVLDNVVVGAYVATQTRRGRLRLARAALDSVGLTHAAHLLAGGITTQQIRLLELARALAGQPKLLLLDETLAGLGAARSRLCSLSSAGSPRAVSPS